jgi:hypothetical protein
MGVFPGTHCEPSLSSSLGSCVLGPGSCVLRPVSWVLSVECGVWSVECRVTLGLGIPLFILHSIFSNGLPSQGTRSDP